MIEKFLGKILFWLFLIAMIWQTGKRLYELIVVNLKCRVKTEGFVISNREIHPELNEIEIQYFADGQNRIATTIIYKKKVEQNLSGTIYTIRYNAKNPNQYYIEKDHKRTEELIICPLAGLIFWYVLQILSR